MTDEKDLEQSPDQNEPQGSEGVETPPDRPGEEASGGGSDAVVDVMDDSAEPGEAGAPNDNGVVNPGDASEDDAEAAMMAMLDELPEEDSSAKAEDFDFESPEVSDAEFQQLSAPTAVGSQGSIDMLMDVDLPVAIELGRTEMTINDILALGPGSVVELNKLAGEPVDLLVNSKVVARGEVVVVDENFGLRVTHLLTPEERLRSLAEG